MKRGADQNQNYPKFEGCNFQFIHYLQLKYRFNPSSNKCQKPLEIA